MERKDVLKSPEYWTAKTQTELYNQAKKFMGELGWNRTQLADYLGVSKGYVSQLLNGDYDHRLSKFFELALSFGVVPQVKFVPVEDCIKTDAYMQTFGNISRRNADVEEWSDGNVCASYSLTNDITMCPSNTGTPKKAA